MKKKFLSFFLLSIIQISCNAYDYKNSSSFSLEYLDQINKLNGSLDIVDGSVQINPYIRIQANKLSLLNDNTTENNLKLQANGNIIVFYKNQIFLCKTLSYDQLTKTCYLEDAKFAIFPWFIGGKSIYITPEKIIVSHGYVSTSEGSNKDIILSSKKIVLSSDLILKITTPTLKIKTIPFLLLPSFSMNIENITHPPFSFHFGIGGHMGAYAGIKYSPINSKTFSLSTTLDGFFTHGIGIGVKVNYNPTPKILDSYKNLKNYIKLKNYYVHKLPINTKIEKDRYRYQGKTAFTSEEKKIKIQGSYDIVDSWETVGDLFLNKFNLPNVNPTEINISKNNNYFSSKLETKVKTNDFLSVNKKLPFLQVKHPPLLLKRTVFIQNSATLGFLKYSFSNNMPNSTSFESLRASWTSSLFKPISLYRLGTFTPSITGKAIFYSKSPKASTQELFVGSLDAKYNLILKKEMKNCKHILEPFIHYNLISKPTIINREHFIFTINDGFYSLNMISFGCINYLLSHSYLSSKINFWTNFIFNNKNTKQLYPKLYLDCLFQLSSYLKCKIESAWIIKKSTWDHFNISCQWAKNENIAISTEFFHRSKYGWKKSDHNNFTVDCAYNENEFLSSLLSERRNILLTKMFVRPHPLLYYKFSLRYGWLNKLFNNYLEYQMILGFKIFDHWNLNTIYEKRECDKRFYCSFNLDTKSSNVKSFF